jgi:peptidyl-prolyl cis-trans isomerase D
MMQFFRRYGWPVFAAAALLLLVWMVWELSGLSDNTGSVRSRSVGTVNGRDIDLRRYQVEVQQEIDNQQRQSGALTAEQVEDVRNGVWERTIQDYLLDAQYKRLGLTASADEIAGMMKSSPPSEFLRMAEFQTEGQFDLPKYQRWLQSSSAQPFIPQMEARYRDEILQGKLVQDVTADINVSDALLWQFYRDDKETTKVDVAVVVPANAIPDSAVPVTEAQVASYYQEHHDELRRPRIAYVSFVSVPRLADAGDTLAALEHARVLRKEILAGAPFAEVAHRESSDSATAAKGGDLGEWKRGSYDPKFEAAAFSLPLNTVSEPVLTPFGYHLIQVYARTANTAKARHILIPIQVTGAHRDKLDGMADTLESLGAEKLDPAALDTVAHALGLKVGRLNPVREGERAQIGLEPIPEAAVWAFQARPGETSRVVEVPYAFYLFRLDSLTPAGVPALSQIHTEVEQLARQHFKWPAARILAQQLEAKAKTSSVAQAAKELKIPEQTMGPFTRIGAPLSDGRLVGMAFALDSGQVSPVLETKEAIYLMQGRGRVKADSAEFAKKLPSLKEQLTRQLRQQRMRNYMEALRASAKIEDHRAEIFKTEAQVEATAPRTPGT